MGRYWKCRICFLRPYFLRDELMFAVSGKIALESSLARCMRYPATWSGAALLPFFSRKKKNGALAALARTRARLKVFILKSLRVSVPGNRRLALVSGFYCGQNSRETWTKFPSCCFTRQREFCPHFSVAFLCQKTRLRPYWAES